MKLKSEKILVKYFLLQHNDSGQFDARKIPGASCINFVEDFMQQKMLNNFHASIRWKTDF